MHALRISTDTADIDMDVVHGYLSVHMPTSEAGAGVQSHCSVCRCVVVTLRARLRR